MVSKPVRKTVRSDQDREGRELTTRGDWAARGAPRRRAPQRWGRLGSTASLLTMAALLTMATSCAPSTDAAAPAPKTLSFRLPDLQGHAVSPADFRGRVVLVDIWATWCKPCKISLPFYAELYQRLEPEGLTILGINVDEEDHAVTEFLAKQPLPFPILRDPHGTVPASIDAEAMPTSVLLGRDGQVLHVHPGFVDSDPPKVEQRIREALAAAAP